MLNIGGDINCDKGFSKLNDYLATRSYIEGFVLSTHFYVHHFNDFYHFLLTLNRYTFSNADTNLYKTIKAAVPAKFPHALRWYNHMKFHHAGKKEDQGKKPEKDDDDDIDLFGSDEEVDAEAEKAREERLKAYAEKKSKSKIRTKMYYKKIKIFYF